MLVNTFITKYNINIDLKKIDINESLKVLGYIMNSKSREEVISKYQELYRE